MPGNSYICVCMIHKPVPVHLCKCMYTWMSKRVTVIYCFVYLAR